MRELRDILSWPGARATMIGGGLLVLIQGISILLQAHSLAQTVVLLFAGAGSAEVWPWAAGFLAAFAARTLAAAGRQALGFRFAKKAEQALRINIIRRLLALGPGWVRKDGTGTWVAQTVEGVDHVSRYVGIYLPKLAGSAVVPGCVLVYLFLRDALSASIVLAVTPLIVVFMILLGKAARARVDRQWKAYRRLADHFLDVLRGLVTLKHLGRSRQQGVTIDRVNEQYRKATNRSLRVAFLSSFALEFFSMLSVALVAVGLGLRMVRGDVPLETALTVLILVPEYFLPIRELGADYHATLNGRTALANIQALLHTPVERVPEEVELAPWSREAVLSFHHVTVRPEDHGEGSLIDVSFSVRGPTAIGIIGPSGSGKSTLIDVLAGFVPVSEGDIEWAGTRVRTLQSPAWRRQITYLSQTPYIFSGTVEENLLIANPGATREELWTAVERAQLDTLIRSFPQGIRQKIGGGGRGLSGGEAQRLALARAFLADKPILLLDEPTEHLDVETEWELKGPMLELFQGRLVFLATHRLHWTAHMDEIFVLDAGRLIERGTPSSLLRSGGLFARLVAAHMEAV